MRIIDKEHVKRSLMLDYPDCWSLYYNDMIKLIDHFQLQIPDIPFETINGEYCEGIPCQYNHCQTWCYACDANDHVFGPCIPTFSEAQQLITMFGKNMFTESLFWIDDYYSVRELTKHHVRVYTISPKVIRHHCIFQDVHTRVCTLHNNRLKPLTGRLSICDEHNDNIPSNIIDIIENIELMIYFDWLEYSRQDVLSLLE